MNMKKSGLLPLLFAFLFLLSSCTREEDDAGLPSGYRYFAGGEFLFAAPYEDGEILAFYDTGTSYEPCRTEKIDANGTQLLRTEGFGKEAYFPMRKDGICTAALPVGGEGIFSDASGVCAVREGEVRILVPGAALIDCDGETILFEKDGEYGLFREEVTVPLGEAKDGWLCRTASDHEKTGPIAVLVGANGELIRYENETFCREDGTGLLPVRGTVAAVTETEDGIFFCDPFSGWTGDMNLSGLVDRGTGGTLTLPLSPDGQNVLLYDPYFVYRICIFADEAAIEMSELYIADGSSPCDGAVLTAAGRAVMTQPPAPETEYEPLVFSMTFTEEEADEE